MGSVNVRSEEHAPGVAMARRTRGRAVGALLVALSVVAALLPLGSVASAATCTGVQVYVTTTIDPVADAQLETLLEDGTGICVTLGVLHEDLDATVDLTPFDVVYLYSNNAYYGAPIPGAGAQALVDFVRAGGGLVTSEWATYSIEVTKIAGWTTLGPILPVAYSSYAYPSKIRFSRLDRAADPILDAGVSADFVFATIDVDMSLLGLKDGATAFYVATQIYSGDDSVQPPAAGPLDGEDVTVGLGGWAVDRGRVMSFATTNEAGDIAADADLRRLLVNSIRWASGSTGDDEGDGQDVSGQDVPSGGPSWVAVGGVQPSQPAGAGAWVQADGTQVPLGASSPAPGQVRYEADGIELTFTGGTGSSASRGLVADPQGMVECEICVQLPAGQVIEVWVFSTPRLVAAWQVADLPCQRFMIPVSSPLDGLGPLPAGVHTLQLGLPTASGMQAVNVGVTVGGPVPAQVPAGEGPVAPAGLVALGLLAAVGGLVVAAAVRRGSRSLA